MDIFHHPCFKGWYLNQGVSLALINEAEHKLGFVFPNEYKQFIHTANGGYGLVANKLYIQFYCLDEIVKINSIAQVKENGINIVIMGSDGGDTVYGFASLPASCPIVKSSIEQLWFATPIVISQNFTEFLDYLWDLAGKTKL